jgi:hypothetical protein
MAGTVTIPVLAICIVLTALVTSAIFICLICLHARRSNRRLEYREEQGGYHYPPPSPAVDVPHVIDLPGSYAGGGTPKGLGSPVVPAAAPRTFSPLQGDAGARSTELLLLPPGSPALGPGPADSRPGSGLVLFPPGRAAGRGREF